MIPSHLHRTASYAPGQRDTLADLHNRLTKELGISLDEETGTLTLRWGAAPHGGLRQITLRITDISGNECHTVCDACNSIYDASGGLHTDLRPVKVETRHPAGSKSPVIGTHISWMCADCRSPK